MCQKVTDGPICTFLTIVFEKVIAKEFVNYPRIPHAW